jgi:splicing factor 3B subunit 1
VIFSVDSCSDRATARVEGHEIISNLAKAVGLATMISTVKPYTDNIEEYVHNTTARTFALGIP